MSTASIGFVFGEPPTSRDGDLVVRVPTEIERREPFFRFLVHELQLPSYFGLNWDALDECLRDLSWLVKTEQVIFVHCDIPFRAGSSNRRIYLELLRDLTLRTDARPRIIAVFPVEETAAVLEALA